MASVTYGKCYLWQKYYGKCNYGKSIMANETEPSCLFVCSSRMRSPPNPLQAAVPHEDLIPNLWEVAAWEIANLGSHLKVVHRGSHPWGNKYLCEIPLTYFPGTRAPGWASVPPLPPAQPKSRRTSIDQVPNACSDQIL